MSSHPYRALPKHCFWKAAVVESAIDQLDPMGLVPFQINRQDKVATAGSCFAQHIARHLRSAGFHFMVTEPPPSIASAAEAFAYNYGTFTARYGNIYTARQLLQLFHRAGGEFTPVDSVWRGPQGEYIDPFRPAIQPGGFGSREELEADRSQHLKAVRTAFASLDVFIFTLGLTEAWVASADGAVFPVCPGVGGGSFDPSAYRLHNFRVAEVVEDMLAFIDALRTINPAARVILTVSPVPLAATAHENTHVLSATTYSKSVLRAACGEIEQRRELVAYMPSYEIITGSYSRGRYFADDLRSVTEAGVSHVMRVFLRHFADQESAVPAPIAGASAGDIHAGAMQRLVETNCDEAILLDAGANRAPACNLCGGRIFGSGPGGRMAAGGKPPRCVQCGALERHRSFARAAMSLPESLLRAARALQVGNECCIVPAWCAHLTRTAVEELTADHLDAGAFGLIGTVYAFEFTQRDQAAFEAMVRLLAPDGVLAICFVSPNTRPLTVTGLNPAALAGEPFQLYGNDLEQHFGAARHGLHCVVVDSADPATGQVQPIHLFFRNANDAQTFKGRR